MHLVLCALVALAPAVAAEATPIVIDDLNRMKAISEPVFAPSGEAVYYVLGSADLEADGMTSDIWRVSWSGGAPERVTKTKKASESSPQFSADGSVLAYLSDDNKAEETQLYLAAPNGRRARQATKIKGGVSDYDLSPDGTKAAVVAEVGVVHVEEDKTRPPIVIRDYHFKQDYSGYLESSRRQIFLVDLKTGAAEQLTTGADHASLPSWSPDGTRIAFVTRAGAEPDRTINHDVFVIEAKKGAAPVRVSSFTGSDADPGSGAKPSWSPDGERLVWLSADAEKWIYYAPIQLTLGDAQGGGETPLARIDRWFSAPQWSADGTSVLALLEGDRAQGLVSVDAASGAIAPLADGPFYFVDYAIAPDGKIAVLALDDTRLEVLFALEDGERRPLADHNEWLSERLLGEVRAVDFKSDGVDVGGLLMLPPGYVEGTRLPLIVNVHGGPVSQFVHEFMFEWRWYAANGYAVLGVNPRGSSGKGLAFSTAIYADWGGPDVKDVLAGVDHVVAAGIADPERIGVGGWSYGGMLTNYLITSDARFKAAVSGAGIANVLAGYGADQYIYEYEAELGRPFEDIGPWMRVSYPFYEAERITTPTLFQCAEKDFNVPCVGAEQMYQALRSLGVESEFVIFPGQNHGLSKPSYMKFELQKNVEWFDRYLKAE